MLQNHHNLVPPQLHRSHGNPKAQLADTPRLMIVPNHHFIRRIFRHRATSNEREYVAPKQHLHDPNAAAVEISPKRLFERVRVEYSEPGIGPDRKTASVLVEREELEGFVEKYGFANVIGCCRRLIRLIHPASILHHTTTGRRR
jgi:hypothetical protein